MSSVSVDAVDDDETEDVEEGQSSRLLLLLLLLSSVSPYFSIPSIEGVHLMAAGNDAFVIHFAEDSKPAL
jgi:hypothetical protein